MTLSNTDPLNTKRSKQQRFSKEYAIMKLFNIQFSNTIETTASAEEIWALWSNVEQWPLWDFELQRA